VNILIWTDNDLDGAASALLIKKLYGKKATKLTIHEVTELTVAGKFKAAKDTFGHYDVIYVLDLDLKEELIELIDIDPVVVIDHHKQHKEIAHLYRNAKVIIEEETSCVKLIKRRFAKHLNLSSKHDDLFALVDDYDCYNLQFKDSLKLNAVFWTLNAPKVENFIKAFKDGYREFTIHEKNAIKLYLKKFKEQIESAETYNGDIKGNKIIAVFADYAINEVAQYFIKKHKADIGIVINLKSHTVSFRRSKKSKADVSVLAKALCEGGGSAAAAGGRLTDRFADLTKNFNPCK
jgi:oligoribonuclease NrnB/cAMP/cGMP phosphodiesterase (DHH superfamily)